MITTTIITAAATGLMLVTSAAAQNVTCVSGAHVIVVRASLEPPGYGTLVAVKNQILSQVPNSDSVAVPYPAQIAGPPPYGVSEMEGVGNLTLLVKQYGDACPDGKMVLMGYSQGAHVVGDTVIGANYPTFSNLFNTTSGLEDKYINQIAAIIMMGDPANIAGAPILVGNSTRNGTFPRGNSDQWAARGLVNRTKSYCDAEDTFCDKGNSIAVHLAYVPEYGNQSARFVVEQFGLTYNETAGNGTTGSGNSTNPTMTTMTSTPPSSTGTPASPTNTGAATSLTQTQTTLISTGLLSCLLAVLFTVIL